MTIIGEPGEVSRVDGYLSGAGGKLEISGFNCIYAVGSLPVCRVFLPPELLSKIPDEQTTDVYQVKVSDGKKDHTIFTGYIAGDNGRITGNKVCAGVDLVHLARDLDETRLSAPSLHPRSISDYSSVWANEFSAAGTEFESDPQFFTPGGGKLPEQIIKALMKHLKDLSSSAKEVAGETAKTESLQKGIDLLGKVTFLDGTIKGSIEGPLSSKGTNSINEWARQQAFGSFSSARSVWDTLTSMLCQFGIYLVCDNEGKVFTSTDCSGMKSPGNKLNGEYIATWDKNSAMYRNVGEVVIATDNVKASDFDNKGQPGGFVSYSNKKDGATLVLQVPGWLNPIARTNDAGDGMVEVQKQYAKMVYGLERNKFRTMSLTGPLAPLAIPGTVAEISPYSAMKAKSGGKIEDLSKTYIGYCHQVSHEIDAQSGVMETTFHFKNVSILGNGDEIDSHPIFSDVAPFTWK